MSRNILGTSETNALMKQTHYVKIDSQEAGWTCRTSQEVSRAIRVAETMLTVPRSRLESEVNRELPVE